MPDYLNVKDCSTIHLAAEALHVAHETGMGPRELADRLAHRDAEIAALKASEARAWADSNATAEANTVLNNENMVLRDRLVAADRLAEAAKQARDLIAQLARVAEIPDGFIFPCESKLVNALSAYTATKGGGE